MGCDDKSMKLIDLKNNIVIKEYDGHKNKILCIKKIFIPQFGECLVTQGDKNSEINLWSNEY